MTIAVAGATGAVGQHVVQALPIRHASVVPIARSHGVDLFTVSGVEAALRGVSAVIDVSNVVTTKRNESVEFFTRATGNLLRACRLNGVERYILLSIVGIDDVPIGYYAGKRIQERLVTESGLTATVVRSTQFHEFAGQMLDRFSIGRVAVVLKLLSRPVAASAVADRLARIAVAPQPPARIEIALLPNGHFEMDQQTFKGWLESQPRRRRRRHPSRRTNRPSRPASTTAMTT